MLYLAPRLEHPKHLQITYVRRHWQCTHYGPSARHVVLASALLSGLTLAVAAVQIALAVHASLVTVVFLILGYVFFGIAQWGLVRAIHSFTDKLELATSDPFGLQYQERAWWEASRPRFREVSVPAGWQHDDGEDKT